MEVLKLIMRQQLQLFIEYLMPRERAYNQRFK